MNKKLKSCIIFLCIWTTFLVCSGVFFVAGMSIGQLQEKEETVVETHDYSEKTVYYSQLTTERYIDKETSGEIFSKLLVSSYSHFTIDFEGTEGKQFEDDGNFILVNLENQYSRLSTKFDISINEKITVRITEDLSKFQEDLNIFFEVETIVPYSAFALGGDLIEVYINPLFTIDKFEVAHTLSHELVHIFQYQYNNDISLHHPKWLIEGMAESFSFPNEDVLIHPKIYEKIKNLSVLDSLVDSVEPENYTIGYDSAELFISYLVEKYGEENIIRLLEKTYTFDSHFTTIIGQDSEKVYQEWLETL